MEKGLVSREDGVRAAEAILALPTASMCEDSVTDLPYPGIGITSGRPPVRFRYVASPFLRDLLLAFLYPVKRRVLIEGPRGFGKSSDLRALACITYQNFMVEQGKWLVCFWNLEAAVDSVEKSVKDALIFAVQTMLVGAKLGDPDADKDADVEDGDLEESSKKAVNEALVEKEAQAARVEALEKALKEIEMINSVDDAVKFVRDKTLGGETFHFFADGWEAFDTDSSGGRLSKRENTQNLLERLFAEGKSIWLTASTKSAIVQARRKDTNVVTKSDPFTKVQYELYAGLSVLGGLGGVRDDDIQFYTGRVPWLLDILTECCQDFSRQRHGDKRHLAVLAGFRKKRLRYSKEVELAEEGEDDLAQLLRENDSDWATVLKLFREHREIRRVEDMIENITLGPSERCYDAREMGKKDMTFFIQKEERYCSGFIGRMYIDGFRRKEEQVQQHA